ncbi:hypothetical protein TNCV_527421 [Trichonephila clavipes]|nr:hypothetical protein TNCV_527421 [Trichonephila clavipes]
MVKGTFLPFHQPLERTFDLMNTWSALMPRWHYSFTNSHAFSGNRTQALRHCCQRHKPLYRMGGYSDSRNIDETVLNQGPYFSFRFRFSKWKN